MLAADVELNPGPVDNIDAKLDNLLQAVALSERRVMSEFKSSKERIMHAFKAIRSDVSSIKSDVDLLKGDHHNICQEFTTLKSECVSNNTKTSTNKQRVTELEDVVENVRLDIDDCTISCVTRIPPLTPYSKMLSCSSVRTSHQICASSV